MSLTSLGATPPNSAGSSFATPVPKTLNGTIASTAPETDIYQSSDQAGPAGPVAKAAQNPIAGPGGAVGMNSDASVGGPF